LECNLNLQQTYFEFMKAYHDLGYMQVVSNKDLDEQSYYLSHYAIIKPIDSEGKIRAVFNASFHTKTSVLLNEVLLP